jgi:hypothetical protein
MRIYTFNTNRNLVNGDHKQEFVSFTKYLLQNKIIT